MDIILRGRYWMDPSGKYTLVPHFAFMMLNEGEKNNAWDGSAWSEVSEEKFKNMVIDLGLGFNYDAAEDVLVVADVGVALLNSKNEIDYTDAAIDDEEYKDNFKSLPYFRLGIDAYVLKWLDFRAGVASVGVNYNEENDDGTIVTDRTSSWTTTETFLGAGLHWGDLMIDMSVDPGFLTEGPYFLSGNVTDENYNGLAGKLSLTYWFE
jgi:hypothetical protein